MTDQKHDREVTINVPMMVASGNEVLCSTGVDVEKVERRCRWLGCENGDQVSNLKIDCQRTSRSKGPFFAICDDRNKRYVSYVENWYFIR